MLVTSVELKQGKYGLTLLDEGISYGDMDYNFMGIPTEGYGFSN
ncbi:MAG: DUF2141 domain-containing protein [Bacteroidota bacterium]